MKNQQGATLAIALILLFIITILGMSAIQMTQMQEKMSANLGDKTFAFNSAESALRAGETWVLGLTTLPTVYTTCSTFPCVQIPFTVDLTSKNNSWWQTNSASYTTSLKNITTPPRYTVEFLQFAADTPVVGNSSITNKGVYYYQITARGTGATDNAVSVLQSTVARRF